MQSGSMVGFDEAREAILTAVESVTAERVGLSAALGRVVAEDVVADADLVPYARSAMDGFALRSTETVRAAPDQPLTFPVAGFVFAEHGRVTLAPGTAMSITTGAPIPDGADAVIPFEEVQRGDGTIVVSVPVAAGSRVFPAGEDVRRGELLVNCGDVIQAATLGLMAFVGRAELTVYRRPRVSVVCTGNELVEVTSTPGFGQIRNSNAFTLTALIQKCGADVTYCGTAPDDQKALGRVLESARVGSGMIMTTGGASVGARDFVKGVLQELGAEFRFRAVAVRPGKPTGFGTWDGTPFFVLPGNPAAVFVCFQEFVRPALLEIAGHRRTGLPTVRAALGGRVTSKAGRRYVVLARLAYTPQGFEVTPLANQCSVLVRTSADSNALIVLPEGPATFERGDIVDVHVLDWEGAAAGAVRKTPLKASVSGEAAMRA
jgi:molybdopterin molybdotransferase